METMQGTVATVRKDRKGFKIGEEWYSGYEILNIKKGDDITFKFMKSGKWNNLDEGSVQVTQSAPAFVPKKQFSGGKQKGDSFEIGVTAGAALNQAVLLMAHSHIEKENLKDTALWLAKLSIQLKKEVAVLLTAPSMAPAPAPAPSPAQEVPVATNDFEFVDDIPF